MNVNELWKFACGLRDGHVRIAGPWRRWGRNDPGPSGWYRPTWDGGVAARIDTDAPMVTPTGDYRHGGHRWALGSAGNWEPGVTDQPSAARLSADAWLLANGWLLCGDGE